MRKLGIIGGSGLGELEGLDIQDHRRLQTPYGDPSGALVCGTYDGREILFLPRHGNPHVIPPHRINYRANIWALRELGATDIVAVNAVGGISMDLIPGRLVVPDQLIDYTWSRKHTFFEGDLQQVTHIDFTCPYSTGLRRQLVECAAACGVQVRDGGTYGVTQGPRLESAAEISRLERDGCDLVGMTGMPEAALAREVGLDYAAIAIVVNPAAGKSGQLITMEMIEANMHLALEQVHILLGEFIRRW